MIKLSEYVDFITSLVEMDEVKQGKFVLPTSMEFQLEMLNHREIHKEVKTLKEQEIIADELAQPFEIDILGIRIRYIHIGYEE